MLKNKLVFLCAVTACCTHLVDDVLEQDREGQVCVVQLIQTTVHQRLVLINTQTPYGLVVVVFFVF